jgi:hypothetical protein
MITHSGRKVTEAERGGENEKEKKINVNSGHLVL